MISPDYYAPLTYLTVFIMSVAIHYYSALNIIKASLLLASVISLLALIITLNIEPYYFKIRADSGEAYKGELVIPVLISIAFIVVFLISVISGLLVNYFKKNAQIKKT